MVSIYCLKDPDTLEIRYVGKTQRSLKQRLKEHLWENIPNPHKHNWIKKLLKENKSPIIELLETCDLQTWIEKEKFWISKLKSDKLLNITEGGEGILGYRGEGFKVCAYNSMGEKVFTYKNVVDASKDTNISDKIIYNQCTLKRAGFSSKKFRFRKESDNIEKLPDLSTFKRRGQLTKRIFQYNKEGDLIGTFENANEACNLNKDWRKSSIVSCCLEKLKTYKGYIFRYN